MTARKVPIDEPAEGDPPPVVRLAQAGGQDVSHNLQGQKLGPKGRGTRDRILAATAELLSASGSEAISLSAVARKASLGMTSLYNYFTDLTELLLALLEPVMAESEGAFIGMLRQRWADDELSERCYAFVCAYHAFWLRHTRLLHLRNTMADSHDQRMMIHRVRAAQPVIGLLIAQMDDDGNARDAASRGMATVMITAIERTITTSTDVGYTSLFGAAERREPDRYLRPEARLLELAIRDTRAKMAQERAA